jgi:hypothetical protein
MVLKGIFLRFDLIRPCRQSKCDPNHDLFKPLYSAIAHNERQIAAAIIILYATDCENVFFTEAIDAKIRWLIV